MLTREPTPEMIQAWKAAWNQYKDKLRLGRKSGAEMAGYLAGRYPLRPVEEETAKQAVIDNVIHNQPFAGKLPEGAAPSPVVFVVKNSAAGTSLYENQDEIFKGCAITVGIDLASGYYCVEGSSLLWDELCAFQGLDEKDLLNFYSVAAYVSCLERFGLLEDGLR